MFYSDNREKPVWGTGVNTSGQIGNHRRRDAEGRSQGRPLELLIEAAPVALPLQEDERVVGLAAGRAHTLILTSRGDVLTLGNNCYGQCGRNGSRRKKGCLTPGPLLGARIKGTKGPIRAKKERVPIFWELW